MTRWQTCLNTSTIKTTGILEKIRVTSEAGFDAIELWINDIYEYIGRGGEVRDIESALGDHGLTVPCMIALHVYACHVRALSALHPLHRATLYQGATVQNTSAQGQDCL